GVWAHGGPPRLQNECAGEELAGGFDSRPPPPRVARKPASERNRVRTRRSLPVAARWSLRRGVRSTPPRRNQVGRVSKGRRFFNPPERGPTAHLPQPSSSRRWHGLLG